jgi:hypothetical protein
MEYGISEKGNTKETKGVGRIPAKPYPHSHVPRAGFFFSAEISEISPKTSFIGDPRYFLIPNEIFRYS